MHLIAGLCMTVVFQLAHVVEGPQHHAPPKNGNLENTWAIHQLRSTANFAANNAFITWYVGGLNFQIEHHLFPNICHVHYKKIAGIVKQTANECGLPYYEHPTFAQALASHLATLKKLGQA
jgi:linoleoyl-CoA desaturase